MEFKATRSAGIASALGVSERDDLFIAPTTGDVGSKEVDRFIASS